MPSTFSCRVSETVFGVSFGPMESPNAASLSAWLAGLGMRETDLVRVYRTFNAGAAPFREASEAHD